MTSVLDKLHITEKVLAKTGEKEFEEFNLSSRSRSFFVETKLQKNVELKSNGGKKAMDFQFRLKPRILPIPCYL